MNITNNVIYLVILIFVLKPSLYIYNTYTLVYIILTPLQPYTLTPLQPVTTYAYYKPAPHRQGGEMTLRAAGQSRVS